MTYGDYEGDLDDNKQKPKNEENAWRKQKTPYDEYEFRKIQNDLNFKFSVL